MATVRTFPLMRAWLESLPSGPAWAKAPSNRFDAVWADPTRRGPGSVSAVIGAFSGTAYNPKLAHIFAHGGGHAAYGGNEAYAWNTETMAWVRLCLPVRLWSTQNDATYGVRNNYSLIDQLPLGTISPTPQAAHQRANMRFAPIREKVMLFNGSCYAGTGVPYWKLGVTPPDVDTTGPFEVNAELADANKVCGADGTGYVGGDAGLGNTPGPTTSFYWNRDSMPPSGLETFVQEAGFCGIFDPAGDGNGNDVYYSTAPGYNVWKVVIHATDPALDTYTRLSVAMYANESSCAFLPTQRLFINCGGNDNPSLMVFGNVNTLTEGVLNTGTDDIGNALEAQGTDGDFRNAVYTGGICWDPVRNVLTHTVGTRPVIEWTPHASPETGEWTYVVRQPDISEDGHPHYLDTGKRLGGMMGKWNYMPGYDVFTLLCDSSAGEVWIYKPRDWTPTWNDPGLARGTSPFLANIGIH